MGGTGTGDVAPTLSITNVSATEVDGGATVTFTVTAEKGTNDLQSLTVTEDGAVMTDRYTITEYIDAGITLNNPQLLTGNDVNNFVYTVNITVPSENQVPTEDEDYFYSVTIADNKTLSATEELTITVFGEDEPDPGTPTTFEETGVLLNQAGPSGTGGLDLDVANGGTGSQDAAAEIRDLGIDCTIGGGNENWRGLFGTVNGADMRQVDLSQVENFTFETATTVEIITGAYDSGIQLGDDVSTNANCDETTVTDVAQPNVGDLYVVESAGTYYLLRVDEINFVAGGNGDNYVFSIKY